MWRRREPVLEWPDVAEGYRLRVARPDEQPLLAGVEARAASMYEGYGLAGFFGNGVCRSRRFMDCLHESRVFAVAIEGTDEPVGFAMVEPRRSYAYLAELDVDPVHGRRGLGSALLGAVVQWAESGGFVSLWLTTQANIPWNAPFYASHGFRVVKSMQQPHFVREILARQAAIGFPMLHRVAMMRPLERAG